MPQNELKIATVVYADSEGALADTVLEDVAARLKARHLRLAGAVQRNSHGSDRCRCDMVLEDLASGRHIEISEQRGPEARGCRLNTSALEEIVGLVCGSIEKGTDLLIVNKFGKRESEGGGFRSAIELALERQVPVVVAVSAANCEGWDDFAAGLDERLTLDPEVICEWCDQRVRPPQTL